jgi:hypothetical protein
MKVTHHGLPRSRAKRRRLEGFLGDVRATLMRTAQRTVSPPSPKTVNPS